jgi:hypothetical protein
VLVAAELSEYKRTIIRHRLGRLHRRIGQLIRACGRFFFHVARRGERADIFSLYGLFLGL